MAANPQQQPLKAGVSVFADTPTFQAVIDKNPDFPAWTPEDKNALADMFFNEKYSNLSPEDAPVLRTEFNKKYGVGTLQFDNPLKALNAAITTGTLAAGSVLNPAVDAMGFGVFDSNQGSRKIAQQQFPGIEADPGLLGQAYRLNKNPAANIAGNILGSFGGTGGIIQGLNQTALRQSPRLLNTAAAGTFSGLTNLVDAIKGNQTPLEALGNTGLATILAPLAGANRWKNAAIQGAAGAVSGGAGSALSDITRGFPVDTKRLVEAAFREGSLGAGMGLAFGGQQRAQKQKARPIRNQVRGLDAALEQGNQMRQATQLRGKVRQQIESIKSQQGLEARQTAQSKIRQLNTLYERLDSLENMPGTPGVQKQNVRQLKASVQREYGRLKQQYETDFPKPVKAVKPGKKAVSDISALNALTNKVYQLRKEGRAGEADALIGRAYDPKTKARIYDAVKRREIADKAIQSKQKSAKTRQARLEDTLTVKEKAEQLRQETQRQRFEQQGKLLQAKIEASQKILANKAASQTNKVQASKDLIKAKADLEQLRQIGQQQKQKAQESLEEQKYRNKQALQAQKPAGQQKVSRPSKKVQEVQGAPKTATAKAKALIKAEAEKIQISHTDDKYGYVLKNGKRISRNAYDAMQEGRYPLKKAKQLISKITGLQSDEAEHLAYLTAGEWHHTTNEGKKTDFFDVKEAAEIFDGIFPETKYVGSAWQATDKLDGYHDNPRGRAIQWAYKKGWIEIKGKNIYWKEKIDSDEQNSGRTTLNPAKKAENIEPIPREDNLPGLEAVKDHPEVKRRPELIEKLNQAYQKHELVKRAYDAEKVGTEIDKPDTEGSFPFEIRETKSGQIEIKFIDGEGQVRSNKLFDGKGDSLLDDVKLTGKKSPYELVGDLDDLTKKGTPRQRVLDTRTDNLVEIFKPGEQAKTSEIRAAQAKILDVADRIQSGDKVSTRELIDTARALDKESLSETVQDMSEAERKAIHKKLTGEDC